MIKVVLPTQLRALAHLPGEILLDVSDPLTFDAVVDALEAQYPRLHGALRDPVTRTRRPKVRFFACGEDYSHLSPEQTFPEAVKNRVEPLLIVAAISGG